MIPPHCLAFLPPTLAELNPWLVAAALNTSLLAAAFLAPPKLLTPAGYLHAWVLGVIVWGTLGWRGYAVVLFYFLVGSGVTRLRMAQKEAEGIAEKRSGERGPENVWGSALTGALCAMATQFVGPPLQELFLLGYAASFSTKLSDTTASEVGKAYGQRTVLITTLKPVPKGTEGAISLEGTAAGIAASAAMALLAWAIGMVDLGGVACCLIAAFMATHLESLIGATLQSRWPWLTNEAVNVLNTSMGAAIAMAAASVLPRVV